MSKCRDCYWASHLDTLMPICCLSHNAFEINPDRERNCSDFQRRPEPPKED